MVFLGSLLSLSAQKKERGVTDYMPTEKLDRRSSKASANEIKTKPIASIYVTDAKKILYGNPCALATTRQMGFEYILEAKRGLISKKPLGKFLNNSWVKTRLCILRSPFWKVILNKRIKKCQKQTGDFVG